MAQDAGLIDTKSSSSMLVVRGGRVYSPADLGIRTVVGNSTIVKVSEETLSLSGFETREIDATGCIVIPGFVDSHCHLIGGGGESGPSSRVPEPRVDDFLDAGVTTAIGVLGTDGVSRTVETLLFKARGLTNDGITALMFTGNYHWPLPTLTGSVKRDICLIEQVIGVGEIAISDHRSSYPSQQDLAFLASEARIGGMLSGKAGKVHIHMGDYHTGLQPIFDLLNSTPLPITQFVPTHLSRNPDLIKESQKWFSMGGWGDITAGEDDIYDALLFYKENKIPMNRMTVSSDAFGSLPVFNEKGELIKYGVGKPTSLLDTIRVLRDKYSWKLEEILPLVTSQPAECYSLTMKGRIEEGKSTDLVILDETTLEIKYVVSKGRILKTPTWTHTGMF